MSKLKDHLVVLFFDLCALSAATYCVTEYLDLVSTQASTVAEVSYYSNVSFILLAVIIVPIHLWSVLSQWMQLPEKYNALANRLMIACFVALVGLSFWLKVNIATSLVGNGFSYCEERSEQMTFGEFKTYLADMNQCKSTNINQRY